MSTASLRRRVDALDVQPSRADAVAADAFALMAFAIQGFGSASASALAQVPPAGPGYRPYTPDELEIIEEAARGPRGDFFKRALEVDPRNPKASGFTGRGFPIEGDA